MMIKRKGVDVSKWQGVIDFETLADNVDFAILKAGGSDDGYYTDRCFMYNYENAKSVGLPVGAYYFAGSDFLGFAEGAKCAEHFLEIIDGLSFEYPVYIDVETTSTEKKEQATQAVIAFCDTMEDNGYYVGIYGSDISTFKDRLYSGRLRAYDKWVARYGNNPPSYEKDFGMWQFTSRYYIDGIQGQVDVNYAYKDYPEIMARKGLNKC